MENLLHYVATHHFLPWQALFINLDTDTAQNWAKSSWVDSLGNHYQLDHGDKTCSSFFGFYGLYFTINFWYIYYHLNFYSIW